MKLEHEIGISDNFFRLGGHSLSAVRLIGIIEKRLNYQISLKTIFDHPTIESLSEFLQEVKPQKLAWNPISIIIGKSHYPITLPQSSIWLAGIQGEKSIAYNMFVSYDIEGILDRIALERAFKEVINKYEVLRTNIVQFNDVPYQKITSEESIYFEIDQFVIDDSEVEVKLENYVNQEFDLECDLLLRVGVFQKAGGDSILTCVTHHVIMDGWSLELLINEITERYKSIITRASFSEDVLKFQFKDYAVWQHEQEFISEPVNHQFWKEYLSGYQWKRLITPDHDSFNKNYSGTFYHFKWDHNFLKNLEKVVLEQKSTLHTILTSALYVLIYRMEKLEDICLGTINSGRPYSELHNQIGMFVKTLPLRMKISSDQIFSELAQKLQEDLLSLDLHQDIPKEILNVLRLEAIIVLQNQNFEIGRINLSDELVLKYYPIRTKYNRLPLLINFSVTEKYLSGVIHYDTGKFEEGTIEVLILKYKKILDNVIFNANILVGDIDIDLPFEKEKTIDIDFGF